MLSGTDTVFDSKSDSLVFGGTQIPGQHIFRQASRGQASDSLHGVLLCFSSKLLLLPKTPTGESRFWGAARTERMDILVQTQCQKRNVYII